MAPSAKISYLQVAHRCGYTFASMPDFATLRGGVQLRGGDVKRYDEPCLAPVIRIEDTSVIINQETYEIIVHLDGSFDLLVAHADGPR